jgi:Ca-activated chloride channel homolog
MPPPSLIPSIHLPVGFRILASGVWLLASGLFAGADEKDATAEPVSRLVAQLSRRETLGARDYAEFARTTVTYGERQKAAQKPMVESALHDALAAVSAGKALDPSAADWTNLQEQLEKLLKKDPPPPPKPENPPDQKPKDEKQQQQEQKERNSNKDNQKSESTDPKNEKSSDPSQQEKSKEGEKTPSQPPPSSDAQSAFKDMDKEKASAQPPPPADDVQKVGGNPDKKPESKMVDPVLAVPLQRLEQVRQGDAPGKLQQLMRGENKAPQKPQKDW